MQEHAALLRPVKSEFNAAVSGVARGKAERESIDDHDVQVSILCIYCRTLLRYTEGLSFDIQ